MALSTAILRAVPGAFILNSGIGKLGMDAGTAAHMQGMAAQGVPPLSKLTPEQFAKFIQDETTKWAKVVKASGATVD